MTTKTKNNPIKIEAVCDKYLERLVRYETTKKTNASTSKGPNATAGRTPLSTADDGPRGKHKIKQHNFSTTNKTMRNPILPTCIDMPDDKRLNVPKARHRTLSNPHRSLWSQELKNVDEKSGETYDPLKSLHVLYQGLKSKLGMDMLNDEDTVDILNNLDYTLKQIPPDLYTFRVMQEQQGRKQQQQQQQQTPQEPKVKSNVINVNKTIQTPPILSREDSYKLQTIITESASKLETSMKQLEALCSNLKNENDGMERELQSEKEHSKSLNEKINQLEAELDAREIKHNSEIGDLQNDVNNLQKINDELQLKISELSNNNNNEAEILALKSKIGSLESEKVFIEQKCSKLQYNLTVNEMEKEKYVVMLKAREKEIDEIHGQMNKIQEEVHKQLLNLNKEIVTLIPSPKSGSDYSHAIEILTKNHFDNISSKDDRGGDSTISSIASNYTTAKELLKERGGDADFLISVK